MGVKLSVHKCEAGTGSVLFTFGEWIFQYRQAKLIAYLFYGTGHNKSALRSRNFVG